MKGSKSGNWQIDVYQQHEANLMQIKQICKESQQYTAENSLPALGLLE